MNTSSLKVLEWKTSLAELAESEPNPISEWPSMGTRQPCDAFARLLDPNIKKEEHKDNEDGNAPVFPAYFFFTQEEIASGVGLKRRQWSAIPAGNSKPDNFLGLGTTDPGPECERRIYVLGLHRSVVQHQVSAHFLLYGKIERISVRARKRADSVNYAMILFRKKFSQQLALFANPHELLGKRYYCRKTLSQSNRVLVRAPHQELPEYAIHNFFSRYGPLAAVDIPVYGAVKLSQNHCFVTYVNQNSVEKLMRNGSHYIDDNRIEVERYRRPSSGAANSNASRSMAPKGVVPQRNAVLAADTSRHKRRTYIFGSPSKPECGLKVYFMRHPEQLLSKSKLNELNYSDSQQVNTVHQLHSSITPKLVSECGSFANWLNWWCCHGIPCANRTVDKLITNFARIRERRKTNDPRLALRCNKELRDGDPSDKPSAPKRRMTVTGETKSEVDYRALSMSAMGANFKFVRHNYTDRIAYVANNFKYTEVPIDHAFEFTATDYAEYWASLPPADWHKIQDKYENIC